MRVTNRFARGSGVYACRCCGRNTRSTGRGDNENVQLCAECYDLAGYENMVQDGEELSAADIDNIKRLLAEVKAKGGNADKAWDYPELLSH